MTTEAQTLGNNPLLGAWALVSWEISYNDGRASVHPFGLDPSGMLLYTADGYMNANVAKAGRGSLGGGSARSASPEARLAAFDSYFQYGGAYTLQSSGGKLQVVHRIMHSLNPDMVGTSQVRDIGMLGKGRISLSASEPLAGGVIVRRHCIVWTRF